jgi:hypothetical protein
MFAYGEVITRLRGIPKLDPYSGEPTDIDWTTPDSLNIPGCGFDPGGSVEPLEQGRQAVVTTPRVFAPAGVDVAAHDRVVVRGRTWQVKGDPADWRHPMTGWAPGLVIELEEVAG